MIKKKSTQESSIEEYFTKKCKELDIFVLKNTGMRGIPDRLIIKNGHHFFVELKKPGEKARELQQEVHRRLRRHGATVFTIDNKQDIDHVLDQIMQKES